MTPFTKFLLWMAFIAFSILCGMFLVATGVIASGKLPWTVYKAHIQANQTLVVVGDWCSGTIIDQENGLLVTAAHCTEPVHVHVDWVKKPSGQVIAHKVDRFNPVTVTIYKFNDTGEEIGRLNYTMKVLKAVYPQDVAILQNISQEKFPGEVRISIVPVKYGDAVFTVGNPLMFFQVIAQGRVTKPKHTMDFGNGPTTAIIFDSFMAPGSSGGGLFNDDGELIGITDWGKSGGPYLASPAQNVIDLLNLLGFLKSDKLASAK